MVLIAPLALLPCVVKNAESSSLPTGTKQQQQTAYQTPTAQASPAASESPLASQAATPDDKTANAPEQSTCRRFFNLLLQFNWSNWAIVLVAIWAALTAKNTLTSIQSQAETAKQDLVITNRAHLYLSEVRITFYEPQNVYEETTTYRFEIVYPIYNGGKPPLSTSVLSPEPLSLKPRLNKLAKRPLRLISHRAPSCRHVPKSPSDRFIPRG